jgi:hypothetical protein
VTPAIFSVPRGFIAGTYVIGPDVADRLAAEEGTVDA